MSGYLISLSLVILAAGSLQGQSKFLPSAFRVGTDLTDLLHSAFDQKVTKYQLLADIDVHKFFLVGEYGNYKTITYDANYRYDNDGSFWRVGFDYNMLHGSVENNALFVGLRYAQSNFDDQTLFILEHPIWGTRPVLVGNEDIKATWYVRVRLCLGSGC